MNKTDMVTKLAEKNGMTKKDAQKALNSLIEIISDEIKDGGSVALTGFGTFSIAERKPRTGRNPQTGTANRYSGCQGAKVQGWEKFEGGCGINMSTAHDITLPSHIQ
jgi:DNA-binding protein HU-beta